jgi:hypothetical protein
MGKEKKKREKNPHNIQNKNNTDILLHTVRMRVLFARGFRATSI